MFSNPITRRIESTFDSGGPVWYRLHSERENICEAMVRESKTTFAPDCSLEVLQSRLRKIDDALDRLFSGSYGNCSHCGKRIEEIKLGIDAATALCSDCLNLQAH